MSKTNIIQSYYENCTPLSNIIINQRHNNLINMIKFYIIMFYVIPHQTQCYEIYSKHKWIEIL